MFKLVGSYFNPSAGGELHGDMAGCWITGYRHCPGFGAALDITAQRLRIWCVDGKSDPNTILRVECARK